MIEQEIPYIIPPQYQNLRYLGPDKTFRDSLDHLLEKAQLSLFNLVIMGKENIPKTGRLVVGVLPHSGIVEAPIIDSVLRDVGRQPAVWIAKKETEKQPPIIIGDRRLIFVDREHATIDTFRLVNKILKEPEEELKESNAIVASLLEGTRKGNLANLKDFRKIKEAEPGLMFMAMMAGVPILGVVVLGAEQVLADPETIKKEKGVTGVICECFKAGILFPRPTIHVYFAPPYTDHLSPSQGMSRQKLARSHTDQMIRECLIPKIREIDPNYPLGFYG